MLTVMTAYNRVNGQYCSENEFLLTQVLKKEWGFTGMVMTIGVDATPPFPRQTTGWILKWAAMSAAIMPRIF